ncbi:hypothetical protein CC1G_15521 [Coprinopsis cinerea okayama7|nr:hypothetical protein CC1G_15521 [Coprinopsis cinerea okayama7\|eukprot:XP_002910980.1 hypothetical protein CC1G_15521 [Coprinopsis cinerea okayama7\
MVIVHINGIHRLVVYPCACIGAASLDEQCVAGGLYPSTFKAVETVFTYELLHDFNLASLECRTSASEYFSKLRRLTNPDFPDCVPNRHRELLRTARQFRHLKELVQFGFTTREAASSPGSLAIFCAACPQPDINLEENWEQDRRTWKFAMSFVADGNFVCVRQSKKGAGQDLFLKRGQGYFVESEEYKRHLRSASEEVEPSTCNEHRAVADKNKGHKGYDATGIGALACARHGAFVPSSIVDFQKGERQMNMDYSLCKGLKTVVSPKTRCVVFIYDICCQYWKNLLSRTQRYSPKLDLPWYKSMTFGIGQFHVHGHQERCLPRFSPLYIDGLGWNTGEILESNWSLLNPTGILASTMTEAHRLEVLDGKLLDLNWKKLTNLHVSLPGLLKTALTNLLEFTEAVEMLKSSATADQRAEWDQQLKEAQRKRENHVPEAMDILMSTIDKAPSRKTVEARLITEEINSSRNVGMTSWIQKGILIQELQIDTMTLAKDLGSTPSDSKQLDLERKRAALKLKHDEHFEEGLMLFPVLAPSKADDSDPRARFFLAPIREPCTCEEFECGHLDMNINPFQELQKGPLEKLAVLLPSSEPHAGSIFPQSAREAELALRKAQADESLANIRTQVGYKSFLFKANVQLAENKAQKTRGYAAVSSAEKAIQRHTRVYNQAQWAITQLTDDLAVKDKYRPLLKGDAKPLQSIYQPNAPGQSHEVVSWIWGWKHTGNTDSPEFLAEICRLNWLRTTSRLKRWEEEVLLVRAEMGWTVRYMERKADEWEGKGGVSNSAGVQAVASCQAASWRKLAFQAKAAFKDFMDSTH